MNDFFIAVERSAMKKCIHL